MNTVIINPSDLTCSVNGVACGPFSSAAANKSQGALSTDFQNGLVTFITTLTTQITVAQTAATTAQNQFNTLQGQINNFVIQAQATTTYEALLSVLAQVAQLSSSYVISQLQAQITTATTNHTNQLASLQAQLSAAQAAAV
jgi:hypothetical protein